MASIVVAEIPCDVPLSRSSILSEARDVYNHGSTLNSVAGDIHYHNYSAHKGHGLLGSGTVASTQSELPSQLYSRLLMREGRGYPLFDATLPNELPEEYQLSGAMIGDVGIVTPDGYFDVLFNICEPADGPINGGCVPDGFITLERPPRNRHNYRKGRSSDLGTWVASDAVEVTPHQTFSGRYPITCGPGEGSILVLPEGAVREDLLRREGFLEYASKHGVSWYAFANTHLGRGVANGAMYLITGFDKANSWGTASFFSSDITPRFRMCFSEGSWVDPGRASTRKGPGGMCNSFENQCLFLRGYKVTLNSRGLTSIFGIKVVETSPLGGLAQDPIRQNDSTPFPSVVGLLSIWRSIAGSDEVGMNPEVTATEPELSLDIHPSNLINTYLLSKFPECDLAITHDSIWCSYLEERRGGTQDYKSLLDYVDHKYVVHKEGSAVYFDDKSYQERLNMEYTVTSEVYPQPTATGKMLDGEEGTDQPASILRACTNCQATKSTLWRRDPAGKLLCNSCGSFFRLHGVARPLSRRTDVIKKRNRASGSSSDSLRKGSGNKSRPRSKSNPNGSVTGGGDFAPAARGLTTIARNAASGVASTGIPATKRQRRTSIASTATPTNN